MSQRISSVSSKGQVTIPVEIRRLLGVVAQDKVAFVVEDDAVRLVRLQGSVVERTAGALRAGPPARSAEDLRAAAEEAIAQEAVEREEA
ncbi:MAG TPA: AbrB/MazE/SpoVT family DNA-binding domain-containing protein [Chloroflexota bacterium]|jgi:AbrB family looped-hinge helix DNA binding protein|nr:AbrB/MazE/SpoVT family DNA-binding domain-containing protein [Chloroflexota bacterium]